MLLAAFALAAALAAEPEPEPAPEPERKTETRKSYLLPAFEIIDFEFLLNRIDYAIYGEDYDVDGESIRRNLRTGFVEEHDPFTINQLGHPYQGSIYHGFARSTGLNFWEALGYTFAGSLLWEIAGETTPPSRNDQIASGIGGSFLGEPLFRMASLLLERGHARRGWLETGAALISPPTGLNRLAGGDRYDAVFDSRGATYYSRFQIGVSGTIQSAPETVSLEETEGLLDFSLEYGLPGARGYAYRRPFDYFAFQGTASTANGIENVLVRGLLAGRDYGGAPRAACGGCTPDTTTSPRRPTACRARHSRSGRPGSGGCRSRSRCRERCSRGWATRRRARWTPWTITTTTTASRRRRCSRHD
ncbi:MAG TPA: DUF3943 domain-containing protein [Candidatus Polarisedimenticolaceae bacterium]|nr:DUF3943 domain-containing protein [Candidatus Polarisedimenticolaceae bacterium]